LAKQCADRSATGFRDMNVEQEIQPESLTLPIQQLLKGIRRAGGYVADLARLAKLLEGRTSSGLQPPDLVSGEIALLPCLGKLGTKPFDLG